MSSPTELPGRVTEIYREHGPEVLARKALGFPKSVILHRGLEFVARDELRRHADDRGLLWQETAESPCTIPAGDVPPQLGRFAGEYRPDPRFLCELPDCRLIGPGAVGLIDGRRMLLDTAGSHRENFFADYEEFLGSETPELLLRRFADPDPAPTMDRSPVLPLVPFYDNYYYPWFVEYLPKLRTLERYEAETGREPAILIERDAPSFVGESLELLGYGDRVVEWDGSERRVEELLVTNHRLTTSWAGPRYGFDLSIEDSRWVRESIRSAVGVSSAGPTDGKRLYVSRQATDRGRRVANYDELEPVLDSFGFEPYVFEELPFPEQVRLVSDAEAILAPHGAGLANALFADDPTVVELFPETHIRPSYYLLSRLLGFEYEPLIVEASEHDPHDDLLVDPEGLSSRLDAILDSPE